jgi:hypothetical protein
VYDYDPETKQQSSQWKLPNSPRPKKAHQVRSNVKSMLWFPPPQHPRNDPQRICTPWSNCKWQVLLYSFEAGEEWHSVQMSRQMEEQLVSSPQQHAC